MNLRLAERPQSSALFAHGPEEPHVVRRKCDSKFTLDSFDLRLRDTDERCRWILLQNEVTNLEPIHLLLPWHTRSGHRDMYNVSWHDWHEPTVCPQGVSLLSFVSWGPNRASVGLPSTR